MKNLILILLVWLVALAGFPELTTAATFLFMTALVIFMALRALF